MSQLNISQSQNAIPFIDTHCHLNRLHWNDAFPDVQTVIEHATYHNVGRMLTVSVNLAEYSDLQAICAQYPQVSMSVGVHPCEDAESLNTLTIQELVNLALPEEVIAIGETGLDYHYSQDSKQAQQHSFVQHIVASKLCKKPLIIHTREAKADTLAIIKEHQVQHAILHCFTEDWPMAQAAIEMGLFISFSGIISFKNAQSLRDVCKQVPLNQFLIETDSPYLAPVPYRGKANVPGFLPHVAQVVADIHGLSVQDIAAHNSNNFNRLLQQAKNS